MVEDIVRLNEIVKNLQKRVEQLEGQNSLKEEYIIKTIIDEAISYYDYNGKEPTKELFLKTGVVSIKIENDKVFLFALNPTVLVRDDQLWERFSDKIKKEFNLTIVVGQYEVNNNSMGISIFEYIRNYLNRI
jgi:hypothetical protein